MNHFDNFGQKNTIKPLFIPFFACMMAVGLTACGGTEDENVEARIQDIEYQLMQLENEDLKTYIGELESRVEDLE